MLTDEEKLLIERAERVVRDMRFTQASAITAMRLHGKAYAAASDYMAELRDIDEQLRALLRKTPG